MTLLLAINASAGVSIATGNCDIKGTDFSTFDCGTKATMNRYRDAPYPSKTDPKEASLYRVDFRNSTYACQKLLSKTKGATETVNRRSRCGEAIDTVLDKVAWSDYGSMDSDLETMLGTFYNRFKDGSQAMEKDFSDKIDLKPAEKKYSKYLSSFGTNRDENGKMIRAGMSAPDSVTEYDKTLASILLGIFTADPDYFETGFVKVNGDINLNSSIARTPPQYKAGLPPHAENAFAKATLPPIADLAVVPGETELARSARITTKANSLFSSGLDQLKFFNKHALGYLVGLNIDMKKVYNKIIMMFFLVGGLFSIGFFAYRKALEKYGNEPFQVNKLTFLSTAMISMTFFTAPVINDDQPFYSPTFPHIAEVRQVENWSTLAQETIRYTLQTSTYFANMASDMVASRFYQFAAEEQGGVVLMGDDVQAMYSGARAVEQLKYQTIQSLSFYENVCRTYYAEFINKNGQTLAATTSLGAQVTSNYSPLSVDTVLTNAGIQADRISLGACAQLEEKITLASAEIILRVADLNRNVTLLKSQARKGSSSTVATIDIMNTLIWGQKQNGWINVVTIPPLYFYFKNAGLLINSPPPSYFSKRGDGAGDTEGDAENKGGEIAVNFEEAATTMTDQLMLSGYWFILPGFSEIYQTINGMLKNIYVSSADIYSAMKQGGTADKGAGGGIALVTFLNKIKTKLSAAAGNSPNASNRLQKVISQIEVASKAANSKVSNLVYVAMALISLYLAITIITFGIGIFTVLVVSAFLSIKIILYFIQVLIFFIAAPILGVYSTILGQGASKNYLAVFSKSLAGLFLVPLIIVLIAALIPPISVFFNSFFNYTMTLIIAAITMASEQEGITDATGVASVMTIKGIAMIFSYLSAMVVSVMLILNMEGWIKKMIGIEGDVDSFKESSSEFRGGAAGKTLNPVS